MVSTSSSTMCIRIRLLVFLLLLVSTTSSTAPAVTATTATTATSTTTTTSTATATATTTTGATPTNALLVVEGIELADTKFLNGTLLARNGEGVRSVVFLGFHVKVYVAGFYTQEPLRSLDDVMNCRRPKQFDFTFLRSVGQQRVKEAWERQLEASVSEQYSSYPNYEQDKNTFIDMFGPIEKGGTETVQFLGDNTIVMDQGVFKGVITGRDFQRAFLSMWFGDLAVTTELKEGLLGLLRPSNTVSITTHGSVSSSSS